MSKESLTIPTGSKDLLHYSMEDMEKNFKQLNNGIISIAKTIGTIQTKFTNDIQLTSDKFNEVFNKVSENAHVIDVNMQLCEDNIQNLEQRIKSSYTEISKLRDNVYSDFCVINEKLDETHKQKLELESKFYKITDKVNVLENLIYRTHEHNTKVIEILQYNMEAHNSVFSNINTVLNNIVERVDKLSKQMENQSSSLNSINNIEMLLMSVDNNMGILFTDNRKNSDKMSFIIEKTNNLEMKLADCLDRVMPSQLNDLHIEKSGDNQEFVSVESLFSMMNSQLDPTQMNFSQLSNANSENDDSNVNTNNSLINNSLGNETVLTEAETSNKNAENSDSVTENTVNDNSTSEYTKFDRFEIANNILNNSLENRLNNNLENSLENTLENSLNNSLQTNDEDFNNFRNNEIMNSMDLLNKLSSIYDSLDCEIIEVSDENENKGRSRVVPEDKLDTEKINLADFSFTSILIPPEDRFKADDELIKLPPPPKKRGRKGGK